MASSVRPLCRTLARTNVAQALPRQYTSSILRATSQFHTSSSQSATPSGPPPKGFRLPRPQRFDEGESSLNKAGNYFLLTEIFRGMYVVLEQYFRPPYVTWILKSGQALTCLDTRFTIHSRRDRSHHASVANTRFEDIRRARSDVLLASYAKQFVLHKLSQSKQRSERTGRGGLQDTILI